MESSTEQPEPLGTLIEILEDAEYKVEQPLPGVLRVQGRFSNTERIALQAAADAGDQPVAIWAISHHDDWTLAAWDRPELVTITQRGPAPQRWRHRQLPPQLQPNAPTFLEGAASRFDIVTRPKHRPTDAARAVLESFGITEPAPPGWEPPVVEAPPVVESTVPVDTKPTRSPSGRTRTPKEPKAPAKPEPVVAVCPTCFMALPATGVCDNCG
ncbi:hypothetical protein E8D34_12475 [Nocardioides sp. GY 10113]|uniref:hypothetical protein n=1 Tax=Nocardioides sp. GY 10113 TaxID=2569761 RepID=UPI0010A84EA7|nr:hypothetical protein [Nocardioides sp. GY 10113]TIC85909.1 hypothetical protein E8D34_12475 [Nocardioides sp. GY 10113]